MFILDLEEEIYIPIEAGSTSEDSKTCLQSASFGSTDPLNLEMRVCYGRNTYGQKEVSAGVSHLKKKDFYVAT